MLTPSYLLLGVTKKTKNMKEFAIGVATITIGVTIGMVLASLIEKKLLS